MTALAAKPEPPAIEARDLAVVGGDVIVNPTDLRVRPGIPFTILGETGSGKSLLAQAIAGTLPAGLTPRGQARVNGIDVLDLPRAEKRRRLWGREIAILPQEPWLALDPTAHAASQIREGFAILGGLGRTAAANAAGRALHAVGLGQAARRLPSELSGGMAQRLAFAAARAGGAGIVIADEPTKGLDADRRDEAVDLLKSGMGAAGGLLVITHDVAVPKRLGGEMAVMLDGRIVESGPVETVLAAPRHEYTRRLLAADPAAWPVPAPFPHGAALIEAEGVTKTRGGRELFGALSLTVHRGEIVGIVGPSGCGKSTLGDLLLGLLKPDRGSIRRDPAFGGLRFQKVWQDPPAAFAPRLTLRQAVADLVRRHRLADGKIAALMERLRLAPRLLDRRPGEISGGELQRFSLLRALALDPVFLFADEPTSRLDMVTQQEIIGLLRDHARETGCALLLVSHDLELVGKTADRIVRVGAVSRP